MEPMYLLQFDDLQKFSAQKLHEKRKKTGKLTGFSFYKHIKLHKKNENARIQKHQLFSENQMKNIR